MSGYFQIAGADRQVYLLGVRLVGITDENVKKLLMTVGFIVAILPAPEPFAGRPLREDAIGDVKDAIGREILDEFEKAGIEIASGTYEVVGMPELRVSLADRR